MTTSDHSTLPSGTHPTHPPVAFGNVGVLLVNLGTPDTCDKKSVRRYLAEFLSDRRVIELHPLFWQPILRGIILQTRPAKTTEAYEKVWFNETDESPLRYYTRLQAEKLAQHFLDQNQNIDLDWAMRYGQPSIKTQLLAMKDRGCDRILIAPLYPQYSATTTATVNDRAFDVLKEIRWQPAIRTLPPYFDQPDYIDAIANSIRDYLTQAESKPDVLLASFHGLPQEYFDKGDPYYCHCAKTTRLIRDALGMDETQLVLSFQSRFGPKQWLQPYTVETLETLAKAKKSVAVFMPGFSADCLETLEEMNMQNRDHYLQHGGDQYDFIPCLNDSPDSINMLAKLIHNELQGWI